MMILSFAKDKTGTWSSKLGLQGQDRGGDLGVSIVKKATVHVLRVGDNDAEEHPTLWQAAERAAAACALLINAPVEYRLTWIFTGL